MCHSRSSDVPLSLKHSKLTRRFAPRSCFVLGSLCSFTRSIQIGAAVPLAYMLSVHPRLERIEVENCGMTKTSQCYVVAGIASNRWVPIGNLVGFRVAPPLVELGLVSVSGQDQSNTDCFRWLRDQAVTRMKGSSAMQVNTEDLKNLRAKQEEDKAKIQETIEGEADDVERESSDEHYERSIILARSGATRLRMRHKYNEEAL